MKCINCSEKKEKIIKESCEDLIRPFVKYFLEGYDKGWLDAIKKVKERKEEITAENIFKNLDNETLLSYQLTIDWVQTNFDTILDKLEKELRGEKK